MTYKAWIIAAAIAVAVSAPAHAGTARLILESDVDKPLGEEFQQYSYASVSDLISDNPQSSGFLPRNFTAGVSLADFAYDNGTYRLLIESNVDAPRGEDLLLVNYDSWADYMSGRLMPVQSLPVNIGSAYSIKGFTYDGAAYRLLAESDLDSASGVELGLVSFDSLADLLAGTFSSQQSLPFDLAANLSVAGLGFDNGIYRLLLESDADSSAGSELSLISYASFADLVANTPLSSQALPQNIAGGFSVHGLDFEPGMAGPDSAAPEPATWAMLMLGFGLIGSTLRRRREKTAAPIRSVTDVWR